MSAYLIYARRSSESGDDFSLDTQIAECRRYAEARSLSIAGEVRENFTGTKHLREREQGAEVWQRLQRGEVAGLIVYCIDRLSRARLRHALGLIDEIIEFGAQLHSVDVGPITDTDDISVIIRSWQASEERKKIVERLARGKLGKAQSGKWPGDSKPNFGYIKVGLGKDALLVIEPTEAVWVQRIYNWYTGWDGSERIGLRGLVDKLYAEGVRTKQGRPTWNIGVLRGLLTSEIYRGVIVARGVPIQLPELRLVSDELWAAAQVQRETNQRLSARNGRHEYLTAGFLMCGECGSRMYGVKHTARKGYYTYMYRCAQMLKPPALRTCTVPWVSVPKIDALVWQFISERLEPERLAANLAALDQAAVATDYQAEIARADAALKTLTGRLRILLRTVRGDEDDAALSAFDAEVDALREEITQATARRDRLLITDEAQARSAAARAELLGQVAARRERLANADFTLKREMLEIVGAQATLGHRADGKKTLTIASLIAPTETIDVPRSWRRKRRKVDSAPG